MVKGINLIEKIIEFIELIPENLSWNFDSLNNFQPYYTRLKQIESLLIAFELRNEHRFSIEDDIKNIINGQFYENNGLELSKETLSFIHNFLRNKNVETEYLGDIGINQVNMIFPIIMNFKILNYKMLNFNSGWLECSPRFNLAYFHILMVDEINDKIKNKFQLLDDIIELIINPRNLEITEEALIKKFNYISESKLREIDLEHI